MNELRRIAVVAEAAADLATATHLADRRILEALADRDAASEAGLSSRRRWQGESSDGETYFRWASVRQRAAELGIKVHGHFSGEPAEPDAHQATRALRVLARTASPPDAVILLRDSDGDPNRRRGLEQARDLRAWPFTIVLGVANPKRECWLLSGFVPGTPEEQKAHAAATARIGFDPCERPHELTAKNSGPEVKRNAKDALATLTGGDRAREFRCLDAPWDLLERRGGATGLPEYLRDVDGKLLPLMTGG